MIEVKHFSGKMDTDSREANVLPMDHIHALNCYFYGTQSGLTTQNVKGNVQITNASLPGTGNNECLGAVFDQVNQRIFWFNFNSLNIHGIYMYTLATGIVLPLLVNFTDSQPTIDLFGFQLDYPVSNPLILYTTDIDGDILCWTIRNQRPKCLNIRQAITNVPYGSNWLPEYLDVAKEPPYIPPKCAYETDLDATVNNLRKKLFKFKYRYWYRDNEKSTWSGISEIPVPYNYTFPQVDTDPRNNNKIGCIVQSGDASVVKIEIAAAESLGNIFSNYFSVVILNKSDLSIIDNSTYIWRFFNSEAYVFVDLNESLLDFSRVPDTANDQALINGNILAYGGITEGKDPVVPIVVMDTTNEPPLDIRPSTAFSVTQYGANGFQQDKPIKISLIGIPIVDDIPTIFIRVGGTTFGITYTIKAADTVTDVLAGILANAIGQGFALVSLDVNELVIYRVNQVLLNYYLFGSEQTLTTNFTIVHASNLVLVTNGVQYISYFLVGTQFYLLSSTLNRIIFTVVSVSVAGSTLEVTVANTNADEFISGGVLTFINPVNSSLPVYQTSSKYNFGLVYFDKKGKSNGVTTLPDFNVTTSAFDISIVNGILVFNVPYVNGRIHHRPPIWAYSYQWVRTANLTKEFFLYWISDRTYKDEKFAYISIESINAYKRVNKNSIVSYDFIPGDRIKFYILYSAASVPIQVYANEHDYEIQEQVINPDINGSTRVGQFLKIVLPSIDSSFNFGTGLTQDYYYYYIELYTPAKSAGEGLEVYYEDSEEYGIGNAGTTLAFHQGQINNQSANLAVSALTQFNKGDAWYRTRIVGIGNTILYDLVPGFLLIGQSGYTHGAVVGQHLTVQAYISSDYTLAQDVTTGFFQPNYNFPSWTIHMLGLNSDTFRVRGSVVLSILTASGGTNGLHIAVVVIETGGGQTVYSLTSQSTVLQGSNIVLDFDSTITVIPNSNAYLIFYLDGGTITANVVSGFISYSEPQRDFEVGVIDQNFSDFFPSKVNSNGRSWVVNPDEKTNFFPTLIRYGGQYEQSTNINQINIFYPNDFVEAYRSWGSIQRLVVWGTQLITMQERRVGWFGIFAKYLQTSDADTQITTTNEVLTKTNIQYYEGEYGLGKQYTGVVISKNAIYFVDPVRGYECRLAGNGITPYSELYRGQFYIRSLIIPYNANLSRPNGASSKILGVYDTFLEEKITILQEAVNPKGESLIAPNTFSFNETRNGYSSFFSWFPEWAICAEDIIFTWKEGKLYSHNSDTRCTFYGVTFPASVTLVFNTQLLEKKTWEAVSEVANAIWNCPLVYSNVPSYVGQRQESELKNVDFAELEGMFHAAFLRDIHSIGGLLNGDTIHGNYLVVKFQVDSASNLVYLNEVSVLTKDSPLTAK